MSINRGIVDTANSLGMSPLDLATIISYETAGTFDPTKKGPTTKWGQHKGLIQFGQPQAKQFGVDWRDPVNSQLGEGKAIEQYFRASGWKPGMSVLDAYSIVNAGAPGKYNASDAGAGGAPGTVRDKVENQFAPHRRKAELLLASNGYGGTMTDTNPRDDDIFAAWQPSNRFAPKTGQPANGGDDDIFAAWQPSNRQPANGGGGGDDDIFAKPFTPSGRYAQPSAELPTRLEDMTANQLVATYPGIAGDVPPIPGTQEAAARTRLFELQKAPPATLPAKIIGAGEAALSALTGATSGTAGLVAGTAAGMGDTLLSGDFGTQAGGQNAQRIANEWAGAMTYAPKTAEGQQYAANVGESLAPLQSVAPLAQMANIGVMAKAAAAPRNAGIQAGKGHVSTATSQIENAKAYGLPVMTSDINAPTTWSGRMGQAVGERIPLVGTGGLRAAQQEARQMAVGDIIRKYGGEGGAPAINDVAANLLQKHGSDLTKYTGMKTDAINRNAGGIVPINNTVAAIDSQISKLQALNTKGVSPVITKLEDYKTAFQGQNLPNIELLRKQLGEELKGADMASVKTTGEQVMRNVYGGLKQDMGDYIKQTGQRRDYTKWEVANARLSEMIDETNVTGLKSALRKGEATPETIRTLLFSRKPSDVELLAKNLTPEGKAHAKTAIMQEAYSKIGAETSPERFISQMEKLSAQTGVMLTMTEKAELAGLVDALSLTKRAGVANVKPVTGAEMSGFAAPAAAMYAVGGDPVAGLATTATAGLLARAYESPVMRDIMVKIGKTSDRAEKRRLTDALLFVGSNPEAMGLIGGDSARKAGEQGLLHQR